MAAEKQVLFEIENFTVLQLDFYVFMLNTPIHLLQVVFLLFIQEHLLGIKDNSIKHSQKYRLFVRACT